MNQDSIVGRYMKNENIVVVGLTNTFSEILAFFASHKVQHLPVIDQDKLIGIISANDMIRTLSNELKRTGSISNEDLNNQFHVEKLMTPDPITVEPETPVNEALRLLQIGKFQALPVTEDGKLVGIITNKDLVKVFSKELNPPHPTFTIENPGFGI